MIKIGLKFGISACAYLEPARLLRERNGFDFLELFVNGPFNAVMADTWKSFQVPIVLHAPHSAAGMNPALPELFEANRVKIRDVADWSAALNPRSIVYHGGSVGTIEETGRQLSLLKKEYPAAFRNGLIENKPVKGLGKEKCLGTDRNELKYLMETVGLGFCLDFGHALCAAVSLKCDASEYFQTLRELKPELYHLSDSFQGAETDSHLHLGQGNLDIADLVRQIPENGWVTLETLKSNSDNLDDFVQDAEFVRKYYLKNHND